MQRKQEEISQGVLAAEQEIMTLQSNNDSVKVCPNIEGPIIGNIHFTSVTHCLVFVLNKNVNSLEQSCSVFPQEGKVKHFVGGFKQKVKQTFFF